MKYKDTLWLLFWAFWIIIGLAILGNSFILDQEKINNIQNERILKLENTVARLIADNVIMIIPAKNGEFKLSEQIAKDLKNRTTRGHQGLIIPVY